MSKMIDLINLCELSYSPSLIIKEELKKTSFRRVETFETSNDMECLFTKKGDDIYLIFRGSSEIEDVKNNMKFKKSDFYGHKAHKGFVDIANEVIPFVNNYLKIAFTEKNKQNGGRIFISGHSLGGAIANLIAIHLFYEGSIPLLYLTLVTFGSPRVFGFNFKLQEIFGGIETLRVVNGDDLVTKLPHPLMNYKHYGTEYNIGIKDKDKSMVEHKVKSYRTIINTMYNE